MKFTYQTCWQISECSITDGGIRDAFWEQQKELIENYMSVDVLFAEREMALRFAKDVLDRCAQRKEVFSDRDQSSMFSVCVDDEQRARQQLGIHSLCDRLMHEWRLVGKPEYNLDNHSIFCRTQPCEVRYGHHVESTKSVEVDGEIYTRKVGLPVWSTWEVASFACRLTIPVREMRVITSIP